MIRARVVISVLTVLWKVKTRIQLQTKTSGTNYTGMMDCMYRVRCFYRALWIRDRFPSNHRSRRVSIFGPMFKHPWMPSYISLLRFGRLYRGLVPPLMLEAPKRAVKFSANGCVPCSSQTRTNDPLMLWLWQILGQHVQRALQCSQNDAKSINTNRVFSGSYWGHCCCPFRVSALECFLYDATPTVLS